MRKTMANTKIARHKALSAGEGRRAIIVMAALSGLFFLAAFVTAGSYFSGDPKGMSPISKITPLQRAE